MGEKLAELTIVLDNRPVTLAKSRQPHLVYRIGATGKITGRFAEANDASRLQEIAREVRDEYARWIYSFNKKFEDGADPFLRASSFFLTDCSCKRTELFGTFNLICNLILLREIINKKMPTGIELYGGDKQFRSALRKIVPGVPITTHRSHRYPRWGARRLMSDIRYCLEIAGIVLLGRSVANSKKSVSSQQRVFFTIFPKMYDLNRGDRKYGKFVKGPDHYAASIVTDGMHQHVSIRQFFRLRAKAKANGISVIDDYLRHVDWIRGLIWMVPLRFKFRINDEDCTFRGIDASLWVREELQLSASRLSRFVVLSGAISRFLSNTRMSEFIYYLHEYPIGRLLSLLLSRETPEVSKVGYQHGPAAWAKMVYCISPEESKHDGNLKTGVPMPDRVLAEDDKSAEIYRHSGYRRVEVLDRIWRLDYLDGVQPSLEHDCWLIAPGLHDGATVLAALKSLLTKHLDKTILLRTHPLANNEYLKDIDPRLPITVTSESVSNLLGKVGAVFVSYSSIGQEALMLGIPVYFVQIPGVISESPLADLQPSGGWISGQYRPTSDE